MKKIITGFKKGMNEFGNCITIIVNSVLLLVVYVIGVGITSIIAKLVNKHFLETKKSNTKTYWTDINLNKKSFKEYCRQF